MNQQPETIAVELPPPPNLTAARRWLLLLAAATLVVSVVWRLPDWMQATGHRLGEIFFTLVVAMAFTYLLRPFVNRLSQSRIWTKIPAARAWATLLVLACFILLIYLLLRYTLAPVAQDLRAVWDWFGAQNPRDRLAMLKQWQRSLTDFIEPYQTLLPREVKAQLQGQAPMLINRGLHQSAVWAVRSVNHLALAVELLLVPVLVFYFLSDGPAIRSEAKVFCPPAWRARANRLLTHLDRVLDGYVRGQVIMCAIAWVLVTLVLVILGVPHAFTLGLLAGATRAVPVVGPLLGGIPLALVCLIATQDVQLTLVLILLFTVMHFVESKVLLPKIVGHEVDLHPVSVIVALMLGLEFFGLLGVFLAVPVAALIKTVLAEYQAEWAASTPPTPLLLSERD